VLKPREMDPETKMKLECATSEEQQLKIAQEAAQNELGKIKSDMVQAQDTIRRLVDDYNQVSLSRNFAGHIRSAIQMLEYRRNELQSKPNTDNELKLIDESIAKFKEKLRVLEKDSKGLLGGIYDKVKGVFWAN
jgi:DNA repair exonuclease SbcCD ATPase subunit